MQIVPFPFEMGCPISGLFFGPAGRTLAAVWRVDTWVVGLCWWDLQSRAPIIPGAHDPDHGGGAEEDAGYAPDPVLSPDHRFLAYVYIERGPEYSLRFIDRSASKRARGRQRRLAAGADVRSHGYYALHFSPDGRFLVALADVVAADDRERNEVGICRWSVERILRWRGPKSEDHLLPDPLVLPTPRPDVSEHAGSGRALAFSPDGSALAAGLWRDRVLCWDFHSGRQLSAPRVRARRALPRRLAYSPDGRTFVVADDAVTLYEAGTAERRSTLPIAPPVGLHDVAFDPSGRVLATASGDQLVRSWDGTTGAARETFDWGIGGVTAVAFSPDGCLGAAAGEKGRVALWDISG